MLGLNTSGLTGTINPLLLFADMNAKEYAQVWTYQQAKAVTTTRQNVTMGLKKGNTVLLHFQYQGQLFQAILMMAGSVPGSKGGVGTPNCGSTCSPALRNLRGSLVYLLKPSVSLLSRWIPIVSMAPWHNVCPPRRPNQ